MFAPAIQSLDPHHPSTRKLRHINSQVREEYAYPSPPLYEPFAHLHPLVIGQQPWSLGHGDKLVRSPGVGPQCVPRAEYAMHIEYTYIM